MSADATTKQTLVYKAVRARLQQGTYPPGRRLNVAQLAREMGVSTIPVREALCRLEAEGWLEATPNSGMRVASYDVDDWLQMMTPFAVLSAFATAEAAPYLCREEVLIELRELNASMRNAVAQQDYDAYAGFNRRFHGLIFEHAPHPELRSALISVWDRQSVMRNAIFAMVPERTAQATVEHQKLIELIERGAPGHKIEALARAHTLGTAGAVAQVRADERPCADAGPLAAERLLTPART